MARWDEKFLSCGAFAGQAATALGVFVQSVHPSLTLTAENVKLEVSWDLTSGGSGEGGLGVVVGECGGADIQTIDVDSVGREDKGSTGWWEFV